MSAQLDRIESKVNELALAVVALRGDLNTHKAKTSRFSMLLSVLASMGVVAAAMLAKGCV